ncbi:MAG TPA: hypothetical protein VK503_02815 [Candidatus Bathyarchaeia archaeon]|nr:hypothetical protein [Candidatus Bathyarchaeia archaeon]
MDPEKFVEEAFKRDSRIRYVGIVDSQFHIVMSKMREGVQSVTTEEEERNFVQIMPPIIVDAVEKLQPLLGKLDNVTVRYEKVLLVFFHIQNFTVVFSFNPDVSTPFISSLSETMRTISSHLLQ